jgi:osmoprotectant transport system ATP-binding protein
MHDTMGSSSIDPEEEVSDGLPAATIEVASVSKVYPGGVVAVDDVSFRVEKGSITCLMGMSGCGKTTMLKLVNRLLTPTMGEIRVDGKSVMAADPIALRRSMGYVIQGGGLMPHMTVARNIGLVEEVRGTPRETIQARVSELMILVGLSPQEYGHRLPAALSGGQQQRVGIARALMADPPVLLMDEPFGALDPITRSRLHEEFVSLNRQLKKTILLVTHDLAEAFKLGDAIILMNRGRIVQQGTREDFLERPADEFAEAFVRSQVEGIR